MIDSFPRKITTSFSHTISIEQFGLYAVSITARCQEKKFFGIWEEQNLRLEINGTQFREIPPEKNIQLFNIPPAWNGVELRGLSKTPTLHQVGFDLGEFKPKRIPTVKDPKWTENFADDTDEMLLARLILGEAEDQLKEAKIWVGGAVLNRVDASAWPNTIHEVILQKGRYDPFKGSDRNFKKITNPLITNDKLRIATRYESYDIAQKLISGEIVNPTTATHFHGIGVTKDWFIEHLVPQGKFLKQIDDTYFYWSPN